MATRTRTKSKKRPRRKREPWHGTVSGYTNHRCRCEDCRAAITEYMAAYRAERFGGQTCIIKGCKRTPHLAAGNGKCARHNAEAKNG